MPNSKDVLCHNCEELTDDYYVIKTNKGDLYRCAECFEIIYSREQRDTYANNFNDYKIFPSTDR